MLEIALQYANAGWPVFFLVAKAKVPFKGSHGHLEATTDTAKLKAIWDALGTRRQTQAGVALRCGAIAVLDADGAGGLAALERMRVEAELPDTLIATTPRGGIHRYYLVPTGLVVKSRAERGREQAGADGLDMKAAGGYVLLPPCNGRAWANRLPLAALTPRMLDWLAAHWRRRAETEQGAAPGLAKRGLRALQRRGDAPDVERLRSALRYIDARPRDRWVDIGQALKALDLPDSGGESLSFQLWVEWSQSAPDKFDLADCENKWKSFDRNNDGQPKVLVGTIFYLAQQNGWVAAPQAAAIPDQPAVVSDTDAGSAQVNGRAHSQAPQLGQWEAAKTPTSPLIELNERYAVIGDVGGKCLVMGWVPSPADSNVAIPSFQSFKSFSERYANQYVTGSKKTKDGWVEDVVQLGAYWLKWPKRLTYEGIELDPNKQAEATDGYLNLWTGFSVDPLAGSWARMQEHIYAALAQGDRSIAEYIFKFAAWCVQHPGERAEVALVFRGAKGTGKGTFANALRSIFGQHGLQIHSSKHLIGNFNGHLRSCLLLYADEAFWAGDRAGESVLKGLLTEPTLMIEQKGVDAVQWKNRLHVIMTANADWVVPASHDERRYVMVDVGAERQTDRAYFEALHSELRDGGLAAMLHDLLALPLGEWHPRHIIGTPALQEQKLLSLPTLDQWWFEMLSEGKLPQEASIEGDVIQTLVTHLVEHARETLPARARDIDGVRMGLHMMKWGFIKERVGVERARGWRLPALRDARDAWDRKYGVHQWGEKEKWSK